LEVALNQLTRNKRISSSTAHSIVVLEGIPHIVATATPRSRRGLRQQVEECLGAISDALEDACSAVTQRNASACRSKGTHSEGRSTRAPIVLAQTVFLKNAKDSDACRDIFATHYDRDLPVTTYVHQPPCDGAALAVEAWAVGPDSVTVCRRLPHFVSVTYNDITWAHCGGIVPNDPSLGVYERSVNAFARMRTLADRFGPGFDHVMRTWLYLGDIVGREEILQSHGETQRYKELNRARTDFFENVTFGGSHVMRRTSKKIYPASTGIGMSGSDLAMSCLALDTKRKDVFILPLENPQQTPAYKYHARFSPQSPKFSRAMAVIVGNDIITFVSGTASIVESETRYIGDVEKQTEQTIENIARLITGENFSAHELPGAGATLADLTLVRVYVKHPKDYKKCKAVCEGRLGKVPTIYAVADICRPELLVEIEGMAFSKRSDLGPRKQKA
jgi:enamine deaminase RidA (YjgF/YER057c/UK114 family)